MVITDEKWNDIIAATKASIDRWRARAAEHGRPDRFYADVSNTDRFVALFTKHETGGGIRPEMKVVVREIATGEMRSAKVRRDEGRVIGFVVSTPDPKAWKSLADKPADEIVRKIKLTGFVMFIRAQATGITSVSA